MKESDKRKNIIENYIMKKATKQKQDAVTVDYSNIKIPSWAIVDIANVLKTKPIELLLFRNSGLTQEELVAISKVLHFQKSLKQIDLSDNPLLSKYFQDSPSSNGAEIRDGFKQISPVKVVMSGTLSARSNLETIFQDIINSWTDLQYLDLSKCDVSSKFFEMVINKPSLQTLIISSSSIRNPFKLGNIDKSTDASSLILKKLKESADFSIRFENTQGLDKELKDLAHFIHIKCIETATSLPEVITEVISEYFSFNEDAPIELCGEYTQPYLVELDNI